MTVTEKETLGLRAIIVKIADILNSIGIERKKRLFYKLSS